VNTYRVCLFLLLGAPNGSEFAAYVTSGNFSNSSFSGLGRRKAFFQSRRRGVAESVAFDWSPVPACLCWASSSGIVHCLEHRHVGAISPEFNFLSANLPFAARRHHGVNTTFSGFCVHHFTSLDFTLSSHDINHIPDARDDTSQRLYLCSLSACWRSATKFPSKAVH